MIYDETSWTNHHKVKSHLPRNWFRFSKNHFSSKKDERSSGNDYQTLSRYQPTLTKWTYDWVKALRIHPYLPSQFHSADGRPHHDVCRWLDNQSWNHHSPTLYSMCFSVSEKALCQVANIQHTLNGYQPCTWSFNLSYWLHYSNWLIPMVPFGQHGQQPFPVDSVQVSQASYRPMNSVIMSGDLADDGQMWWCK